MKNNGNTKLDVQVLNKPLQLGRLEEVSLRDVWVYEQSDFTPWLAREENIALLGLAIGMELEVVTTEKAVGSFSADILCKDMNTDKWVVIENQLERTDHGHLGQLLTYAAGLHATTVIWVAKNFSEEHRATLDWLNEITNKEFSFLGIEIELLRIDTSKPAPNFKLISKPNDWQRRVVAESVDNEMQQFQRKYWTRFMEYVSSHSKVLRISKPQGQHWCNFTIGSSSAHLNAIINTQKNCVRVDLILDKDNAKALFDYLSKSQMQIESQIGSKLEWRPIPDKKQSCVSLSYNCNPRDDNDWDSQHQWLCTTAEAFHRTFSPLVKSFPGVESGQL